MKENKDDTTMQDLARVHLGTRLSNVCQAWVKTCDERDGYKRTKKRQELIFQLLVRIAEYLVVPSCENRG